MKRFIAPALLALLVAGSAVPASAQGGRGLQLRQRADQLESRIRAGIRDGSLDRREADRAIGELNGVRRYEDDVLARGHGVLGPRDRADISARLDGVERNIHWLRSNDRVAGGPGRGEGPGGGFRYGFGRNFWNGAPAALDGRIDWLESRIRRGIENGSLTRRESDRAFGLLRDFRRERADMVARDGGRLRPVDERYLADKLNNISQQISWLQNNGRRD